MVKIFARKGIALAAFCVVLAANNTVPLVASDHADPQVLKDPDGNITDLFFFPDGDRYVVILDVHRALTAMPPYQLSQYEYRINFDWHTGVSFPPADTKEGADTGRYGGKISNPGGIKEDATIKIHLNDNTTLMRDPEYTGLLHTEQINKFTGLRADPFIFPRFFKKNVISMVFSIPKNAFPQGRDTFLIWAAAFKGDKQVDHVGRSNRTQQARFEALNTLHPSQHVDQIMKDMAFWDRLYMNFSKYRETQQYGAAIQILLQIRSKGMYDLSPDVMVYSDAREHDPNLRPGFPNGRHIQDDVAALTCAEGDCILQELSFVEGDWPRRTVSDMPVPANATFPYLLDPYPEGKFAPNKLPSPLPTLGPIDIARLVVLGIRSVPRLIELELLPMNMWIVSVVVLIAVIELGLVIFSFKYWRLRRQQRQVI
jgi:hypothetical protein